jgi:hypothetical protein
MMQRQLGPWRIGEPTVRFYGTDCALRDPFGNPLRVTQPPNGPGIAPSAEELQAQS